MNSKQAFFGLLGALALLVIISGGLLYFGLGKLEEKGDRLTKLKLEQAVIDDRKDNLVSAKRDIKAYKPLEQISKSIVPQEKDQVRTVREIYAISEEAGIKISSIQFPASALGEAQKKSTSKKKTSKKPAAAVNPETTQLLLVEGGADLYAMEIEVQSDTSRPVAYSQVLQFLRSLENNRRTAHVTNITIEPQENRNQVTFSLTLSLYVKL